MWKIGDRVKTDRSIHGEMVGTIVVLARSLDMEVAAEGLETAEQLAELRNMECEYGQGYYFSRPLDQTAASDLLASQPSW